MAKTGEKSKKMIYVYNKTDDIFTVERPTKEKIRGSIDLDDIIIDINSRGSIAGVEILNASKVLGVSKSMLSNARKAELFARQGTEYMLFKVVIWLDQQKFQFATNIPARSELLSV